MSNADAEALILATARAQHGVVARWQLATVVSASLLDKRVKRGRLQLLARGVYAVPGLAGPHACVAAAVLGAGPDAVASHESAGHLQQIIPHRPSCVVVSRPGGRSSPRAGVVIRRVRLPSDERTLCDGVPVTSPERTILDLAATLPNRGLEQAVARALRLDDLTTDRLLELLERYPRRPGSPRLRAMLTADATPALTRSEAEERFLHLVRTAQLPEPQVNVRLHGFEVDFYWRRHRLVVEIDGMAYHSTRDAQIRDRARDTALSVAGIRVLRFTWRELTRLREATIGKVALALGRGAG